MNLIMKLNPVNSLINYAKSPKILLFQGFTVWIVGNEMAAEKDNN